MGQPVLLFFMPVLSESTAQGGLNRINCFNSILFMFSLEKHSNLLAQADCKRTLAFALGDHVLGFIWPGSKCKCKVSKVYLLCLHSPCFSSST